MPKLIAIVNDNDSNDNNSNDLSETLWSKRRPSLRQNAALFLFPLSHELHQFICPIIQQYAHLGLHQYNLEEQGPDLLNILR